jgi:hypothetical protein
VIGAPLISAGEIEQFLLRIRQMACAGDLAEPRGEIAVMRARSPPNPIAHHRGSPSIPALTRAVLAVASTTRDRFFRVASSTNRTWMPSGSDSIAAKSVLAWSVWHNDNWCSFGILTACQKTVTQPSNNKSNVG